MPTVATHIWEELTQPKYRVWCCLAEHLPTTVSVRLQDILWLKKKTLCQRSCELLKRCGTAPDMSFLGHLYRMTCRAHHWKWFSKQSALNTRRGRKWLLICPKNVILVVGLISCVSSSFQPLFITSFQSSWAKCVMYMYCFHVFMGSAEKPLCYLWKSWQTINC